MIAETLQNLQIAGGVMKDLLKKFVNSDFLLQGYQGRKLGRN